MSAARVPGLGWVDLDFEILPDSAWANGNLAEAVAKLDKILEQFQIKVNPSQGYGTPCNICGADRQKLPDSMAETFTFMGFFGVQLSRGFQNATNRKLWLYFKLSVLMVFLDCL